jgi:hypothetical protein
MTFGADMLHVCAPADHRSPATPEIMEPAESGKIFLAIRDSGGPVRAWVVYQNMYRGHPFWDRLPPRWRWPMRVHFIDVTVPGR